MAILALDIGSSSAKAAVVEGSRILGQPADVRFPTSFAEGRVEVQPSAVLDAVGRAIAALGSRVRQVDAIGLGHMAASWVAMDARGKALTPIVTHQDRRSVTQARAIEARVGKAQHLAIAGVRPIPGGISSTTFAWFAEHAPELLRRYDLVGHIGTFLHRQWTGARVVDPSNATFMGLYRTCDLGGWSQELCAAAGCPRAILPEIRPADAVAGKITRAAAARFGLRSGTPMFAGMVDTGAAFLLERGGRPAVGRMVNVSGSTDVLALCTDRFAPHERLLTRALGVDGRWLTVSTIAAAGSSLTWAKEQLFADLSPRRFYALVAQLGGEAPAADGATFEPYLAGDRMSIEQRRGAFGGLSLATTREDLLRAVIESLARQSAARLRLFRRLKLLTLDEVTVSGGLHRSMEKVLHRDWPGRWRFRAQADATLRGLGMLGALGALA